MGHLFSTMALHKQISISVERCLWTGKNLIDMLKLSKENVWKIKKKRFQGHQNLSVESKSLIDFDAGVKEKT